MKNSLYFGSIFHQRFAKVNRVFTYPSAFWSLDLDEIASISKLSSVFTYNHFSILSLHDQDYLMPGDASLREKISLFLRQRNLAPAEGKIILLTCPRFLGHAFNPISLFYCYDSDNHLLHVLAQVCNTFGEMHVYALQPEKTSSSDAENLFQSQVEKVFHVSPFLDREGQYVFTYTEPGPQWKMSIDYVVEGEKALSAIWRAKETAMTSQSLKRFAIFQGPSIWLPLLRIHAQALVLKFKHHLPFFTRPVPKSSDTLRNVKPKLKDRILLTIFKKFLGRLRKGKLVLSLPSGEELSFGGQEPGLDVLVHVKDWRFFSAIVQDAGVGLGESFMAGHWTCREPAEFLKILIVNKPFLSRHTLIEPISKIFHRLEHLNKANSIKNSRKNISDHYDLGNDFFKLFLDESMTYSSGFYKSPEDSLSQAQQNKLELILNKLNPSEGDKILEIGCGWGSFALKAINERNCQITGITLSSEQLEFARKRIADLGLSDKAQFELTDYRHIEGSYDGIASIEMLEAVGHEFLETYFRRIETLLVPGGKAVIQVISIPDEKYESYRKGCDFIQKHIFPGGHLPSFGILCDTIGRIPRLSMVDSEDIGPHYAPTLHEWCKRFTAHADEIKKLGFSDQRFRAWQFYFAYCEAAFACKYLHNFQFVVQRSSAKDPR